MECEWSTRKLEDCLAALIDYRGKTPRKVDAGIPLVTAKIVKAGRIQAPTEYIAETDYTSWMTRGFPELGDVVMTTEAPLGEVGQIQELPVALAQRIVTLRGKEGVLASTYLLYALQSEVMQSRLRDRSSGTTVLGIKQSELRKVEIDLPPIWYQQEVASVLSCLDDRIDLLRQTNTTLEAIAQALFKSWFVDFDPVHAKAEGREPEAMDAATAALFPSEFEESELGLIPKGWGVGTFADIALQSKGNVSPLKSPENEYEHYSLPAFDAGLMPVRELGETIKSNKTPVPDDAILISKLNPHIPRIWFTGKVHPNAVCSTEFLVWTPARGMTSEYVFCLAVSTPFNTAMKQLVTGTSNSHQRVKPDHLKSIHTVIPPGALTQAFGTFAGPLLQRVRKIVRSFSRSLNSATPFSPA